MNNVNPMQLSLLQYTHLEKLYGYFPGMKWETLAALYGLDEVSYQATRAEFDTNAREAALELLEDATFANQVKHLPFQKDNVILALGDSLTDDLQSWLEILRHLLAETRAHDNIQIINGGLSARTSAMILRRLPATLAQKPTWIFCLLGGNDVTRVGTETNKPQVSLEETRENLLTMRNLAATLTRANEFPPFKMGHSFWRNADLISIGDFIRSQSELVVDVQKVFGVPAKAELQGVDGVHPSLEGQRLIAKAVVEVLTNH